MRRWSIALVIAVFGCGEDAPLALDEPLRLAGGVFERGPFPARSASPLLVTSLESASGLGLPQQKNRRVVGRVSEDAYAIGVRFRDLGSGYWVAPAGALDPTVPGERDFALDLSLGPLPPGLFQLEIAAIDEQGRSGAPSSLDLCVLDPTRPRDLSPCSPETRPPAAAWVLRWDSAADVDLIVETPAGKRVSARRPSTAGDGQSAVTAEQLAAADLAILTYDSNAECRIDGRNAETLLWSREPPTGVFLAYVSLFDACETRSVRFSLTLYLRRELEGRERLVEVEKKTGTLLGLSASGGAKTPLYVTSANF